MNNWQTTFYTTCKIVFHKEVLLSRRPGEPAAGQKMEMEVEHRLSCAATVVDDHTVPALFEPFLRRYGPGNKEQMADKFAIRNGDAMNI